MTIPIPGRSYVIHVRDIKNILDQPQSSPGVTKQSLKVSEESDKFFVVIECCEHNQSENMDF